MDATELEVALAAELARLEIPARPIVVPTPWDIGPVVCYLFPGDPVTLIDCGLDTDAGIAALERGLAAEGLEPADVRRVIVTHMHGDHWNGAKWLKPISGCEVLLHPADIALMEDFGTKDASRMMLASFGFTLEQMDKFTEGEWTWTPIDFEPLEETTYTVGDTRLRVEHHPGHMPGHVWVIEEASGAIFVGDYLLAGHPTSAGVEIDRSHPTGRAQLLEQYNAGLAELRNRDAPVLFAGHGPPITEHADLIDRRLAKSERRTRSVLEAVRRNPQATAIGIATSLYGERPFTNWDLLADVVGRIDVLIGRAQVVSEIGEYGAWHFRAVDHSGGTDG